ncbi:DoxX family protein [Paenibacillus silvae]|uniref:DoxX family protein n=2 Tax=Paenibacillus silvae TaxID=1325358 RepID=A0A2W6PB19_9BACL|nr:MULTISPECIES: DoxX family protein [Paenibacillus]MCK6075908.1 DoxX family protein [Paenibacillus silvae]MCK6150297.1 DoxX family protein [Paenibacillus silvae]MCK6268595.1 DoxX family protein [Paenibacillus silvae]PZT55276.1 DoxX family protein [Paenibacillus silvae]
MKKVLGYVFLVVLAGVFIMTGVNKVTGAEMMIETFESFSYPTWTMYLLGALELLSAVGLLIPRTRILASGVLTFILIGAVGSHLIYAQYAAVPFPAVLLIANIGVLLVSLRQLEEEESLEMVQA